MEDFFAPQPTTASPIDSSHYHEGSAESAQQSIRTISSGSCSPIEQILQPTHEVLVTDDDHIQAHFIRNQQDFETGLPNTSTPEPSFQLSSAIAQTISVETVARRRMTHQQ